MEGVLLFTELWFIILPLQDFEREGPQPFKLAGIGGVSEFFG